MTPNAWHGRVCVVLSVLVACASLGFTSLLQAQSPTPAVRTRVSTTPGTCNYDLTDASLTSKGWSKQLDESFDSLAQWRSWTSGAFNDELQFYQPANLELANGVLLIHARKESSTGPTDPFNPALKSFAYTSGRIESTRAFSAGDSTPRVRIMARIKLPSGYGLWPAFWSYGDRWPTEGEIDILESRGEEPFMFSTNYFFGRAVNENLVRNSVTTVRSATSLQQCWHVYEVIWARNSLTFRFDGRVVDVKRGGYVRTLFGKRQRVALNLAVGGNYFTALDTSRIQTGTMQVDWVKVFTAR